MGIDMTTKARWKKDGKTYLYLGTGFGAFKAMSAGTWMHSLLPDKESGEIGMVALCDKNGEIGWVDYEEVEILEIDGERPADLLS